MKIWQGDPCAPQQFIWSGVNCTYSSSGTPRVTSLNLSYHGLDGAIPNALANLKALNYLDLSDNDLTGPIPPSLEELTSLTVLILSNNRLNGPIPASLCDGQSKGLLELRVDNHPDICLCHSTCQIGSKGRKLATFTIVLIAVVPALIILLLLSSLLFFFLRRKKSATKLCKWF
ncbi:unnamed protein product [Musa banksii]